MNCRLIVCILFIVPFIHCRKKITILSDFTDNKDVEFFKATLPWIVENIGSDISLNFHFKDNGINSGPRKCYLVQLERNPYLQADYLSCLAQGNAQDVCVKYLPINRFYFNRCLRIYARIFIKNAELQFRKIKVDTTPIIILPRRKILTDVTPQVIMKNICSSFDLWKPNGCIVTCPFPVQTTKPNDDIESTTPQQSNCEDDAKPEEEEQPNGSSTPESVTKSEDEKQPNGSSTPESVTKAEDEKQPNESSTTEIVTKPEKDKHPNENSTSEGVTKPEEEKQPNESSTTESVTKPDEEKQPKESSTPESVTKSEEEKQPNVSSTPESVTKSEDENSNQ